MSPTSRAANSDIVTRLTSPPTITSACPSLASRMKRSVATTPTSRVRPARSPAALLSPGSSTTLSSARPCEARKPCRSATSSTQPPNVCADTSFTVIRATGDGDGDGDGEGGAGDGAAAPGAGDAALGPGCVGGAAGALVAAAGGGGAVGVDDGGEMNWQPVNSATVTTRPCTSQRAAIRQRGAIRTFSASRGPGYVLAVHRARPRTRRRLRPYHVRSRREG